MDLLGLTVVRLLATARLLPNRASAEPQAMPIVLGRPFLTEELRLTALAAIIRGDVLAEPVLAADSAGSARRGLRMLSAVAGCLLPVIRTGVWHARRVGKSGAAQLPAAGVIQAD
jgi:hypothetical protein